MPENHKHTLSYPLLMIPFIILMGLGTTAVAYEGIETYYIRYDVKSSKNQIINDNLMMIPGKNDFRAAKFSQISITGAISAALADSKTSIKDRVKENALKTILVKHGLKSVKSKDYDTVISYEGIIVTPLKILKKTYNEQKNNYVYEVQVEFSPIAFPDKWETLKAKHKIKELFNNFLQLFK